MNDDVPFIGRLRESLLNQAEAPSPSSGFNTKGLLAVAAGLAVAISIVVGLSNSQSQHAAQPVATPQDPRFGIALSHPLMNGESVSIGRAFLAMPECPGCPNMQHADPVPVEGYVDNAGGVGFVLADGSWFVGVPDPRSSEQYIADFESMISSEEGSPFHIQQLADGTDVVTAEASESGSAVVMWVEGGRLWEVVGKGGASLSDLFAFAEDV